MLPLIVESLLYMNVFILLLHAPFYAAYYISMTLIEFETELRGESSLPLPPEIARKLPKSGRAKVVVLVHDNQEDEAWRRASYEQFMRNDDPEDAVYDAYL